MKTIDFGKEKIVGLLGPQKRKSGIEYRRSSWCFPVPCEDGTLLYHTLTGALYLLEAKETPESLIDTLLPARFFVPVGMNEHKQARDVSAILTSMQEKTRPKTGFTILITTDCNARCFYCYEMGRSRVPMTERIAHDAAAYMLRVSGREELSITWFGGEPLYNRAAIETICDDLHAAGRPFRSKMVSNGYYLTPDTAKTAREKWNLKRVQITLDGTKEIYQRSKAYIERDPNAFERVLDNIAGALAEGIKVNIRLNMDNHNASDLCTLVAQLGERFAGEENLSVYPALLRDYAGTVHSFESEEETFASFRSLQEAIDLAGLKTNRKQGSEVYGNLCMADNDACEMLLPDGLIGKCEHFSESEIIGSIYSEECDEALIRDWKRLAPDCPECADCALYPRCRHLAKCDWTEPTCRPSRRKVEEYKLTRMVLAKYEAYRNKTESAAEEEHEI